MDTKHLTYFKVENFKRFDSLEVKDIGQFNLIVGDNNVGKTSLLEALLFDDENYDQFLYNIYSCLMQRTIDLKNNNIDPLNFFNREKTQPIKFSFEYAYAKGINTLNLSKKNKLDLNNEELDKVNRQTLLYGPQQRLIEFQLNGTVDFRFINRPIDLDTFNQYYPFIGFTPIYDSDLVEFFSKFSIDTKKLEWLQNELKYFIPNVVSIETNNAIIPQTSILTVREQNADLKPLTQYGDGTIKLLRYLLELDLCENKRLMIDEIDSGIHYSRMKEFLKKVLQTAKNKNVQIFATTHSKECLQYYTEALQELGYENDGRIIKIADTKIGIKSYTYNFEQFENSLYAYSEIR